MAAPEFPASEGARGVYLDNAATSLPPKCVLDAMGAYEREFRANVARGIYPQAERATDAYESARAAVARALDADPGEIVFTSGATAALNLAAQFAAQLAPARSDILVTELEHHSNVVPWLLLRKRGFDVQWALCDSSGVLLKEAMLERMAGANLGAVAISHASNVTGEITDAAAICSAARAAGALCVVDGAQYIPHAFARPRELGADFYAFSGHKCNGPMGVGVLWGRRELLERLDPPFGGGGMVDRVAAAAATYLEPPARFEAGTPPIPSAIGLGASIEWRRELEANGEWNRMQGALKRCEKRIHEGLAEREEVALLVPHNIPGRVPITPFNVDGVHPHDVCQVLGEMGVCVRGGHHCAQPLMRRMGIGACVRASLGPHVTESAADLLLEAVGAAAQRLG